MSGKRIWETQYRRYCNAQCKCVSKKCVTHVVVRIIWTDYYTFLTDSTQDIKLFVFLVAIITPTLNKPMDTKLSHIFKTKCVCSVSFILFWSVIVDFISKYVEKNIKRSVDKKHIFYYYLVLANFYVKEGRYRRKRL